MVDPTDTQKVARRATAAARADGWDAACRFHRRLFRLALHDLANPLAAARLLAELQRRGAAGAADQLDLHDQLGRVSSLLADLRSLFRESKPEICEGRPLLEQVVGLARTEATRVGAKLMVGHVDDLSLRAPRPWLLQAVLGGLLSAFDQGGPDGVFVLACRQAGDDAVFSLDASAPPPGILAAEEAWAFRRLVEEAGGEVVVGLGEKPARDPAWSFRVARAEGAR